MIVLKGQTEASRRPPSVPAHTWGSDEELSTQKSAATQGCVHLEKDDPWCQMDLHSNSSSAASRQGDPRPGSPTSLGLHDLFL